jgi:integrase
VGTKTKRKALPRRKAVARRFTVTRLAVLPPGRYSDPAQESLYLLVRAKAAGTSRTWVHRIKYRGGDTYLTVGHFPETSLAEARKIVQDERELLAKGIEPKRAKARRRLAPSPIALSAAPIGGQHTIENLAHEFMERHVRRKLKRPEDVQRMLDRDVLTADAWKGRDVRTITPREVIELLDGLVDRGSPVAANRLASKISQMFRFGVHRGLVESSPVQLLYRPGGKEQPRERCLTDAELEALLKNPKAATRFERLSHAIVLFLLTAVRRSELALAAWSEIDFDAKIWRVPGEHVKGRKGEGKGHTVPLSDWAVREFEALQRLAKHSRWVLANDDDDGPIDPKLLTRGVARCQERMKKLEIAEFTLHDLRRTCRTGLARLKIAPHIAERVLNHAQETIPGTYDVHDYLEEKREALDKWASHLEGLCEGRNLTVA